MPTGDKDKTRFDKAKPAEVPAERKKVMVFAESPEYGKTVDYFKYLPDNLPGYDQLKQGYYNYYEKMNKVVEANDEARARYSKYAPTGEDYNKRSAAWRDVSSAMRGYFNRDEEYNLSAALDPRSIQPGASEVDRRSYEGLDPKYRKAYWKADSTVIAKDKQYLDSANVLLDPPRRELEISADNYAALAKKILGDAEVNPRDSTFIKEGNNIKEFYKKNSPNTDVEVVPTYGNLDTVKKKIASLSSQDDIALLFHSGKKAFGVPQTDIVDALMQSKAGRVYLGTCYGKKIVDEFYTKIKNKEVYYRPNTPYWGVDPTAKDFLSSMYGRTDDDLAKPEKRDKKGVGVAPPQKGLTYDVLNFGREEIKYKK